LWTPTPIRADQSAITDFARFLGDRTGREFTG